MQQVTRGELELRWTRVRRFMESEVLAIVQNVDMYYLSGTAANGLLWFPRHGEPTLFVSTADTTLTVQTPLTRIVPLTKFSELPGYVTAPETWGLELDVIPVDIHRELTAVFPKSRVSDGSNPLRLARAVKTEFEIERVREAARILDVAFRSIPNYLKEGIAEYELAAEIVQSMRLAGHQGFARVRRFNMEMDYGFVSFGDSAAYPTNFDGPVGSRGLYPALPGLGGRKRLERGAPVMVDVLGGSEGYLADGSRAYSVGEVSAQIKDTHQYVLELNDWIEEQLRPGNIPSAIYAEIQKRLSSTSFARFFMGAGENQTRFVAHGIGLELDEMPVVAPKFDAPLEAGMILAVEPKIFYPGIGGSGTENTYVITEKGCERLTLAPLEFTSVP